MPDNYYSRLQIATVKLASLLDEINKIDTTRDKENDIIGRMFVQFIKFIEAHHGNKKKVSIYGQEYTNTTYKLAKMNLAIGGISANLGEMAVNTFANDQHMDLKADISWRIRLLTKRNGVPMTSRNGEKISVALLEEKECIISSSYIAFEVMDVEKLLPEYLMLWFRRWKSRKRSCWPIRR